MVSIGAWFRGVPAWVDQLRPERAWMLFGFLLVLMEALDYWTGPWVDISFMLLFPSALLTWRFGGTVGWLSAFLCSVSALLVAMFLDDLAPFSWEGAAHFLTLFLFLGVVASLLHALRIELRHHQRLARTDPLTGLTNRRAFDEILRDEMNRLSRFQRPFTLVSVDIDRFKWINDTHGHAQGDRFLVGFARELRTGSRETDTVARVGGDEFALLLPETDEVAARGLLAQLEARLQAFARGQGYPVGASLGARTLIARDGSVEALWEEVDRLMYQEKARRKSAGLVSGEREVGGKR